MKRILLCADGSAYSEACARYAMWVAKRSGCAIEGVYVSDVWKYETSFLSDLGGSLGLEPYHDMLGQLGEFEKQKSRFIETALRELFKKTDLKAPFTFHHRSGTVVETLAAFEEGPQAVSLVMLGKRGENAEQDREHLGSTIERIVRASQKPCLVTPRDYREIKRLLLAYDASPSATRALHWLVQADGFKDLAIHLVTVASAKDKGETAAALQDGENILRAGGWKPSCQLLTGESGDAIASYAAQQKIDCLIMGAYGHGVIRHLIIGSTTTELLRRCDIPVLLFR